MDDAKIEVWVRGTGQTSTVALPDLPADPTTWGDGDVARLLEGMLRGLERLRNPGGEDPPVTLRGFSWIVSPAASGGVFLALEMQLGAAVAGPLAVGEPVLTAVIQRVMAAQPQAVTGPTVH